MTVRSTRKYCSEDQLKEIRVEYTLVEGKIEQDTIEETPGIEVDSYGIRIEQINAGIEEVCEIRDISTDREEVIKLLKRMEMGLVTPLTAKYIVEDYLEEVYG